jgi:predicted transcriptional regulator
MTPVTQRDLTAYDLMHRDVLVVDATTVVLDVWSAMLSRGVEHAVVAHDGSCLGVVAMRAMQVAWGLELSPVAARPVRPLVTATPAVGLEAGLPAVCRALLSAHDGAVMVLADDATLLGLVTVADVLGRLGREDG